MRVKIEGEKRFGTAYPYIQIRVDDPVRAADRLLKCLGPGYCQLLFYALSSFNENNNGSLEMKYWEEWKYGETQGNRGKGFEKLFAHIISKYSEIEKSPRTTRKYGIS